MSALSDLIHAVPHGERAATYQALAEAAMRVCGVTVREVTFLGHNSGAAFRVESADVGRSLSRIVASTPKRRASPDKVTEAIENGRPASDRPRRWPACAT